jgi:hypothetical protein
VRLRLVAVLRGVAGGWDRPACRWSSRRVRVRLVAVLRGVAGAVWGRTVAGGRPLGRLWGLVFVLSQR